MVTRNRYLGDYLLAEKLITKEQLDIALREQKKSDERLGEVLVRLGFINEEQLAKALSQQLDIPYVNLKETRPDPACIRLVPADVCRLYRIVPLFKLDEEFTVAMEDPLNLEAVDRVQRITGLHIAMAVATRKGIQETIERHYGTTHAPVAAGTAEAVLAEARAFAQESGLSQAQVSSLLEMAQQGAVVKQVSVLIEKAVKRGASDIHMEPAEDRMYIRFRIDGMLVEEEPVQKNSELAVTSRIKIMASMNIAEKRLPQDGRIQQSFNGRVIDLRVSTFPTIHGENLVIRVLDKSQSILEISKLGLHHDGAAAFRELIKRPYGMILVTGPTGSGKTTTLYAALHEIDAVEQNVITIEDPVEYEIKRVRQSQVNVKAGLTFANGLRSVVRQDPDIIMIGEIRDGETAEIAIHASLTGHLVLSTIHTNNAASTAARLIDMGVEPFLVSSAVIGILSQRLLRILCEKCKDGYTPDAPTLKILNNSKATKIFRAKGCAQCRETGYRGRIGVFELLVVTDEIRSLIHRRAGSDEIQQEAKKQNMRTLREDGIEKVVSGVTSVEEFIRVTA